MWSVVCDINSHGHIADFVSLKFCVVMAAESTVSCSEVDSNDLFWSANKISTIDVGIIPRSPTAILRQTQPCCTLLRELMPISYKCFVPFSGLFHCLWLHIICCNIVIWSVHIEFINEYIFFWFDYLGIVLFPSNQNEFILILSCFSANIPMEPASPLLWVSLV